MAFRTTTQAVDEVKSRTKPNVRAKGIAEDPPKPRKVDYRTVVNSLNSGKTPDQVYIADALRDGLATVQDISMKHIEVNPKYQARAITLDRDHVKKLAEIRDLNGGLSLHPIVTFLAPGGKFQLADGFHRYEENRIRGDLSIRAYVISVPDWEHQTRLFAAMCNREMCLPRKKEDVRKAVELLFEDPECQSWSNHRIAQCCGLSSGTVAKIKVDFFQKLGIRIPDVIDTEGRPRSRVRGQDQDGLPWIHFGGRSRNGSRTYVARVNGRQAYLGTDRMAAEDRLREIVATSRPISLKLGNIRQFMANRGISLRPTECGSQQYPQVRGLFSDGIVATTATLDASESFPWAYGCLCALRELVGKPDDRMVVICYRNDGPQQSIDLFRSLGVEFLSPDELMASLKGK